MLTDINSHLGLQSIIAARITPADKAETKEKPSFCTPLVLVALSAVLVPVDFWEDEEEDGSNVEVTTADVGEIETAAVPSSTVK